jgi:exopolysaccharide production protein ExoQ
MLFFITIVDNRYMAYMPVLITIYLLRFIYAFMGFYVVFRNLKTTGTTSNPKLLFLQFFISFAIIVSGTFNNHITFGIIYSIFIWIGITCYILNSSITNLTFLRTIDFMYKLIVIVTLVLTVLVPDVMVTYSYDGSRVVEGFFGGKNALPPYLLMGLCLNLLVYEIDGERKLWRLFLYPLVCAILLFVSGSGTGSVIAMIFLILFFTKLYKFLNVYNVIITHTIVFFSIVVYRLHEIYLYPLIVNVLHRDITLTYRTDIWSIAIKYFTNGWLLGYGFGNDAIAQNLALPGWYGQIINETHNGILDIALSLGIMGLIPFLLFIIYIIREYDKSENKPISQVMKLYVFVYFAIAISESAFTISRLSFWSMLFIGLVITQKGKGWKNEQG